MPTLNYDDDPEWTPKGIRKARKKHLKAEVAVFDGSWDDLDQLKDASITVKGKKIFVKKGDYIRVAGEGMAVMEDGDGYNESAMWVGRVERIGRESPDTLEVGTRTLPIWLEVYWLYSKEDIKDIANKSGNKKLLCALEPFGSLERACSVKADTVSLYSVLGLAHVVTFDDRLVSSESGDIDHSTFYVRTDFDYEKEELSRSDNLKPCPCAIGTCKDSYYCPAEDFSQVFCANFGCCLWYHASCVAGTTNSSWYPTPECYTNGRILSVPEPTLQGRSVHPSDAHDFDRTQMFGKLWFISRRYSTLLFALAEQPIVRPTLTSVTGNMADVLKAREFIRDVRFDIINKEGEMEMKRWLGGMKLASVERDAREARARAGGVKKAELESAMREDRDYEQLVCPQCGHPM